MVTEQTIPVFVSAFTEGETKIFGVPHTITIDEVTSVIPYVKKVITGSSNPHFLLQVLKSQKSCFTAIWLAQNPNMYPHVLEDLLKLGDIEIVLTILGNPNTPVEVLEKFFYSTTFFCEKTNKTFINRDIQELDAIQILACLAKNPSIPPHLLEKMVGVTRYSDSELQETLVGFNIIQVEVARNCSTPTHVLRQLSEHSNIYVKNAVVRNSNTPVDVVYNMLVASSVVEHNYSQDFFVIVAKKEGLNFETYDLLSKSKNLHVLLLLASNVTVDGKILKELASYDDKEYEQIVVTAKQNPALHSYLQQLAVRDRVCEAGQQVPTEWLMGLYVN